MERIDELFAEIEEGDAALQRARQGLDTWRRALLKAGVTGELTRDCARRTAPSRQAPASSPASAPNAKDWAPITLADAEPAHRNP